MKVLDALMHNQSVKTLNLTGLQLSPVIFTLSELIQTNRTITAINLSNTGLTDEMVRVLLEALKQNSTITEFDISENKISRAITAPMQAYLRRNVARRGESSLRSQMVEQEKASVDKQGTQAPIPDLSVPQSISMKLSILWESWDL